MGLKTIDTLIKDIHEVLGGKNPLELLPEVSKHFGEKLENILATRLGVSNYTPALRMSNIGKPCVRQTWLSIKQPEKAEELRPETRLKFLYGDLIEELLLALARLAGHTVEGEQDTMEVEGVKGHRDAVIDGVLIDVKSASTYSFQKFTDGSLHSRDPFGYIGQIQTYLEASQEDPLVTDKGRCAFFVMDKTLGHICLDIHQKVNFDVRAVTRRIKDVINSDVLPERAFQPEPDGKSGNMKLCMECSYCPMKKACHSNLRTFLYSNGPRYLTTTVKVPDVPEAF